MTLKCSECGRGMILLSSLKGVKCPTCELEEFE